MSDSQLIGSRFEIGSLVGQGGMGDVYQGRDTLTGDFVAIKVLKPEILVSDPGLLERFEREGEALRRLNHPNIIKMLASIHENDHHYIIMEYVSGGSLRDLLEEQKQLPVERVLEIALDLSDALTRAHRLNIIHRDIKPANVLLAEDGTPRLGDFGVAHMGDRTRVTESGSIIGTYAYMSPEGCMGDELDARADIWSFGVMLYEMLAGRRPFDGAQPATVLTAILSKPVPDMLQFRPDAPAPLLGLIYSMLEKNRDKRISSVRLVGAQLEAFIKGSDTAVQRMTNLFSDPDRPPTPVSSVQIQPPADDLTITGDPPQAIKTPPPSTSTPTPTPRLTTAFPPKEVVGAPRIFVSYRREDSIAVTGRIYDRLVSAFGDSFVFKDVDKIPVGANFKDMLENEVASCDVLLVMIGSSWLETRDQEGHRRLDDPNDFVRIEVKAALDRPDILVIPVLVGGASMSGVDNLPSALRDLAFRNAAVVRNDPDFNRDTAWLIEQIQRHFVVQAPPPQRRPLPVRAIAAVLAALVILFVAVLIAPALQLGKPAAQNIGVTPTAPPALVVPTVEPVASGEYMVLLADIEHVGGAERGVTQLIADDLHQQLETTSFSNLRVRSYPSVIHSDDEARATAESAGAAIIIWGDYDDSGITLKVQTGSLQVFPTAVFPRAAIENMTNLRVQMTDPRHESVAPQVLAIIGILDSVSSNVFELARHKALYDLINVNHAKVLDTGSAARYQDFYAVYTSDPSHALDIISQSITADSSNPLLYISRALIRQSLGQFDSSLQDVRTATLLGPKGWMTPTYFAAFNDFLFHTNYAQAVTELSQVIEARPDDWYAYGGRGGVYYLMGEYDKARADLEQSNALNPQANYFYPYTITIAMRQGRFADAQKLVQEFLTRFPDPEAARRILDGGFGSAGRNTAFGPLLSAFGNMLLGQWDQALTNANAAIAINPAYPEEYLFKGMVECNLKNYSEAEADYTHILDLDPTFTLVYGLRAEVLLKQKKLGQAIQDVNVLLQGDQAAVYQPLIPLIQSGTLSCENFLTYDFAALNSPATTAAPVSATAVTQPTPIAPTLEPTAVVEPVSANEYTVLIADLEPLGEERDVTRFITRDLTGKLEQDIPFSHIQIKSYPQVITSDDEARQAAQDNGAAVIVWGNYTPDLIELNVQIGSIAQFPNIAFDRQTLEQTANVTARMTDERSQSVITPVLAVLTTLQAANGNAYEDMRFLAILNQINVAPLEIEGDGLAAHTHRSIQQIMNDTPAALDEASKALALDPGSALAYAWRSLAQTKLGQLDEALQDANTAIRRGPQGWSAPLYLQGNIAYLQNKNDDAIGIYTQVIQQNPDDWFPYNMRGWFYYLKGDFASAKADYASAFERKPDTNFPYIISALIALREGRMADARANLSTILRDYPDPAFANRLIRAAFGDQADKDLVGPMFSAVGDFTLGQYDQMLTDLQKALTLAPNLPDLHALEGFAYCNLKKYPEAEQAYNEAITLLPDAPINYVLRADVRLKQLNLIGANDDDNHARDLIEKSGQGTELTAYLDGGLRGQVGCDNFLDWQPPA